MSHRIHFYATREDLEPVIREIEAAQSFRYALCGLHRERTFPEYASASEIPSLGRATHESAINCDAYLVIPAREKIVVREVRQNSGDVRYAVDQLANPRSLTFQSGGRRDDRVMIHGRAATTAVNDEAKQIFSLFSRWIKKRFEKRQAFYVGPEAMRLKQEGYRLTMAVQSPSVYDLA